MGNQLLQSWDKNGKHSIMFADGRDCKECLLSFELWIKKRHEDFIEVRSCLVCKENFENYIPSHQKLYCSRHQLRSMFYCSSECLRLGWFFKKDKRAWENAELMVFKYLQTKFPRSKIRKTSPDFIVRKISHEVKHTSRRSFMIRKEQTIADYYFFIRGNEAKILEWEQFRKYLRAGKLWQVSGWHLQWNSIKNLPSVPKYADFEKFFDSA